MHSTEPLPQEILNIEKKIRSNPLPWRGQFSPQLIEAFLKSYATNGDTVLDPFVGSGTVLYECSRLGFKGLGVEVNPAAAILANLYSLSKLSHLDRKRLIEYLTPSLNALLFSFKLDIERDLLELKHRLDDDKLMIILEALICLSDFYKRPVSPGNVSSVWTRLCSFLLSLPHSSETIKVIMGDARKLPLPHGCVDLVLTSPPYINVFNYHQQYRSSMEALGWNIKKVSDSEIGSNRKHRGNRLLTVIQYCLDMTMALIELHRVLKDEGRIIFVVGRESNVRKTSFYNGRIIKHLAVYAAGYKLELQQERFFVNRYGQKIFEDILHFLPARNIDAGVAEYQARSVALKELAEAAERVPAEAVADLWDALSKLHEVGPSPIFEMKEDIKKTSLQSGFNLLVGDIV